MIYHSGYIDQIALIKWLRKWYAFGMTVFIIHGCPSDEEKAMNSATRTYDKHWIPWTRKKLEAIGFKVETPLMPNPWQPVYESFKDEFQQYTFSEEDIFIGHSCGCAFLVRWFGETKQKAKKLIMVAPWKIPDGTDEFRKNFYEYEIDKSIKDRIEEIIIFTSDDEEGDGKKSVRIFVDALGASVVELKGHGHYTLGDMGTDNFPELLETINHNYSSNIVH